MQAAKRRRSISSDGSSVPIHRLPAALHSCHSQHSLKGHANLSRSSTPSGPHSLGKHVLTYRCPFGPPGPAHARARPGPVNSGPCLARPYNLAGRAGPWPGFQIYIQSTPKKIAFRKLATKFRIRISEPTENKEPK